jgi:hypothetical protein
MTAMAGRVFTVRVHSEDQALCAEVLELPGCFASSADWDDLRAAVDCTARRVRDLNVDQDAAVVARAATRS